MSAFENAAKFFHACESLKGWAGCKDYVVAGAPFMAQAEPLEGVTTVQGYCEWMASLGGPMPGCHYELHASAWDEGTRTALFFATFVGRNTGPGPVPPTGRETRSHYVYALTMNGAGQVENMVKIWNAGFAMKQLGWG